MSSCMTAYVASLEHEIEQLNNFKTWAIGKIGTQEIESLAMRKETVALRQELDELRDTIMRDNNAHRRSIDDNDIASPVTPVSKLQMGGETVCSSSGRTKRTVHFDDAATKNAAGKKTYGGSGSDGPSTNAACKKKSSVLGFDAPSENPACKKKTSRFGIDGPSANARSCTIPADAANFDLSFSDTATQSPPNNYQYSGLAAELSDAQEDDEDDGNDDSVSQTE